MSSSLKKRFLVPLLSCVMILSMVSCGQPNVPANNKQSTAPQPTETKPDRIITVPTRYYQQYGSNHSLPTPSDTIGGWKKANLKLNLDKTAIVVMHAAYVGKAKDYPEQFGFCEYITRSYKIAETVFPNLLAAARGAGIKIYHVPYGAGYYEDLPGYKRAVSLAEPEPPAFRDVAKYDDVWKELIAYKDDFAQVGNRKGVGEKAWKAILKGQKEAGTFMDVAKPVGDEGIANTANQLAALAVADGVNHLIYIGFAVDTCLLSAPCGMIDMGRRGFLYSAVADATTAVENKESGPTLAHTETALWRVSVNSGFVYDSKDLINSLRK